jgi:hypothetical protein
MAANSDSWAQISAQAGIVAAQLETARPSIGNAAIFPRCGGTLSTYAGHLIHDRASSIMMDFRPENSCPFVGFLVSPPISEVLRQNASSSSVCPATNRIVESAWSMNHEVLPNPHRHNPCVQVIST